MTLLKCRGRGTSLPGLLDRSWRVYVADTQRRRATGRGSAHAQSGIRKQPVTQSVP